jgi:CRISPR-associated protein Cas2
MTSKAMTMVFCYDVESDRARRRVATILETRSVRVQKSVFEVRLSAKDADRLFDQVREALDPGDSLRMYALSATGLGRCRCSGGAPIPEDGDYWLV